MKIEADFLSLNTIDLSMRGSEYGNMKSNRGRKDLSYEIIFYVILESVSVSHFSGFECACEARP